MTYLDTSVGLAHLLGEDRCPPSSLWAEEIVSSRLLQYEIWSRINSKSLEKTHGELARRLLARVAFIEMSPLILERAKDPFPLPLRTLDALHLATIEYLRACGQKIALASHDDRMNAVARLMGIPLFNLE
jgi:predicted nucleic acid-binding protein